MDKKEYILVDYALTCKIADLEKQRLDLEIADKTEKLTVHHIDILELKNLIKGLRKIQTELKIEAEKIAE